jgi:hypothetical protein
MDLVDSVFHILKNSDILSEITGGIYKYKSPDYDSQNEPKENIVINSLPITAGQLQLIVINVNVHVPNLIITINGQPDRSKPDLIRLDTLAKVITTVLDTCTIPDGTAEIQHQRIIPDPPIYEHYINIRLSICCF